MRLKLSILCAFMALFATQTWAQTEDNPEDEPVDKTSVLLMPNAFSPNGDGINDIYKPKDGYKNISEFHAYI